MTDPAPRPMLFLDGIHPAAARARRSSRPAGPRHSTRSDWLKLLHRIKTARFAPGRAHAHARLTPNIAGQAPYDLVARRNSNPSLPVPPAGLSRTWLVVVPSSKLPKGHHTVVNLCRRWSTPRGALVPMDLSRSGGPWLVGNSPWSSLDLDGSRAGQPGAGMAAKPVHAAVMVVGPVGRMKRHNDSHAD